MKRKSAFICLSTGVLKKIYINGNTKIFSVDISLLSLAEVSYLIQIFFYLSTLQGPQILKFYLTGAQILYPLAQFLGIQRVLDVLWLIQTFLQTIKRLYQDASK